MTVLWFVVFVDLLGFGILVPLVPFFAARLGLSPATITLDMALHSLFQFLGAPVLGRNSDRFGRRPVLIISMLGHAAAYLLLGLADSIALLVLSRVLSGFTSGNLGAAYAYIADVSEPAERARGLARVSSAFSLGYALGPLLGGIATGDVSPLLADLHRPAFMATALSLLATVAVWLWLPESHHPSRDATTARQELPARLQILRGDPALVLMLSLSLTVWLCAAMRESLLALWAHDKHRLDTHAITLLYATNGFVIAGMQFFFTGSAVQKFGEIAIVRLGIVSYGIGWLTLVLAQSDIGLHVGIVFAAIGTAWFGTGLQTLISLRAAGNARGTVMGIYQSSAALARFGGAALSGSIYESIGQDAPFVLGAVMALPALALTFWIAAALRRRAVRP